MAWIRRNFGLKVAAVVTAVVLWFTFNYLAASQTYSKTLEIPLALHGVAAGLVASSNTQEVSVELTGQRAALEQLAPENLVAYVDCSGHPAGTVALTVSVTGPESDKIRSVSPPTVVIVLDRYAFRRVPVISDNSGQTAIAVDTDPKTVVVAGAQTAVSRVMAAQVSVSAADATKRVAVLLKAQPVDVHLTAVSGLTIAPSSVRVSITPRRMRT